MASSFQNVSLYLARTGDSFLLRSFFEDEPKEVGRLDPIHPALRAATACQNCKMVLDFLNGIKENREARDSARFLHFHNNEYIGHAAMGGGGAHMESVEEMIKFVQMKMKEVGRKPEASRRLTDAPVCLIS